MGFRLWGRTESDTTSDLAAAAAAAAACSEKLVRNAVSGSLGAELKPAFEQYPQLNLAPTGIWGL